MASLARAFLFKSSGVAALPGYSIFNVLWAGSKTSTQPITYQQTSAGLGGGEPYPNPANLNDVIDVDVWLDTGTYKICYLYYKNVDQGIVSVQLDGVTQGAAIDAYAASLSRNNYTEITGLAVTAGVKTWRLKGTSKNASSSGYYIIHHSKALIRTGA